MADLKNAPRAERRRQESTVMKVVAKRPEFRDLAQALRADAALIASYIEKRSMQVPSMPAFNFVQMVKAEIVAMKHYDDAETETRKAQGNG